MNAWSPLRTSASPRRRLFATGTRRLRPAPIPPDRLDLPAANSDILKELSRSLASAWAMPHSSGVSPQRGDLAENPLLALVRTGIENDFEEVVFPQYPLLGNIKRILAVPEESPEQSAVYAALSVRVQPFLGFTQPRKQRKRRNSAWAAGHNHPAHPNVAASGVLARHEIELAVAQDRVTALS